MTGAGAGLGRDGAGWGRGPRSQGSKVMLNNCLNMEGEKTTCCSIPFTYKVKKRPSYGDRAERRVLGPSDRRRGVFGGDGDILKLDLPVSRTAL